MVQDKQRNNYIASVIFLLYVLFTGIMMVFHEMWRDEWLAIQLATKTQTISDLLLRLPQEGHPPLWYFIIRATAFFSNEVWLLQAIHLGISWCTAYLLLFRFKLSWQSAFCILFSYFLFFEYTVIVRNYNLTILFSLLAIIQIKSQKPKIPYIFTLLCLMCLSNVYGIFWGIGLAIYFLLNGHLIMHIRKISKVWLSLLLLGSISTIYLLQLSIPPQDHIVLDTNKWSIISSIKLIPKSLSAIWNSFVPLPSSFNHFWNSNVLDILSEKILHFPIGQDIVELMNATSKDKHHQILNIGYLLKIPFTLVILTFVYRQFRNQRAILWSLLISWSLIYCFQTYIYFGFLRHAGAYFISYLLFTFLSINVKSLFFQWICIIHCLVSLIALIAEIKYDFSASKVVSQKIIQQSTFKDPILVMDAYSYIPSITGPMHESIWIVGQEKGLWFVPWEQFLVDIPLDKTVQLTIHKMNEWSRKQSFIIFVDPPEKELLQQLFGSAYTLSFNDFTHAISREDFYLVKVEK